MEDRKEWNSQQGYYQPDRLYDQQILPQLYGTASSSQYYVEPQQFKDAPYVQSQRSSGNKSTNPYRPSPQPNPGSRFLDQSSQRQPSTDFVLQNQAPPSYSRFDERSSIELPTTSYMPIKEDIPSRPAPLVDSSKDNLPIAIPQMNRGRGTPFQRLYAPKLQGCGISEAAFVEFIDTLNVVSAVSPPLKILDLAGGIIGMVPNHWTQLASHAISLTVIAGKALVSKSRTDSFLSEQNEKMFKPLGLRVALITTEALLAGIGFPREKKITLPLVANIPLDQQPKLHTRLLQGLRGYVSDTIATDFPPAKSATNIVDKMSERQVKREIESIDKKIMKKSEKQMRKHGKHDRAFYSENGSENDDSSQELHRSRSLERKIKRVNKHADKKLQKGKDNPERLEAERNEAVERLLEKDERKRNRRRSRSRSRSRDKHGKKDADEKFAGKLLWVFVDRIPRQ